MSPRRRRKPHFSRAPAIAGIAVLALVLSCCQSTTSHSSFGSVGSSLTLKSPGAPTIRVAVLKAVPAVQVLCSTANVRVSRPDGQVLRVLPAGTSAQITLAESGPLLDGEAAGGGSVFFESVSGDALQINGSATAARVIVARLPGHSGLAAIAQFDLEEYLAGVLAGEVPERWHPEA